MIKPAVLEDELFVVIIPEGDVLQLAGEVQKLLSREYNIYKEGYYPQIHLTIDRIKKGYAKRAAELIKRIVDQYERVNIIVKDFDCVHFYENKYLMLDVVAGESLTSFAEQTHNELRNSGLSVIEDYEEWEFHITIISNLFSEHPLTESEFKEICLIFQDRDSPCISSAESVEIWRPTLNPSEKCLHKINFS